MYCALISRNLFNLEDAMHKCYVCPNPVRYIIETKLLLNLKAITADIQYTRTYPYEQLFVYLFLLIGQSRTVRRKLHFKSNL